MSDATTRSSDGQSLNDTIVRNSIPSAVDAMVQNIRGLITDGRLTVGDSLPTERELCERFQASRNTVREAMRIMKAYGMVSVRPKIGAIIIDDRMERALDLFSFNTLDISRQTFSDVQGLRQLIEISSVDIIFDRITATDIVELRDINGKLRDAATIVQASEMDFQFHLRLVAILNNRAVLDVYRIMKPVMLRIMERAKELRDFTGVTFDQHDSVIDGLALRDRIHFQYALQSHLQMGKKAFNDREEAENTLSANSRKGTSTP